MIKTSQIAAIMSNIKRYSITPSLIQESDAEHAFLTSFLIIEASTKYKELFKKVDRESLLIRATLHDLSESIVGDVSSVAKRSVVNGFKIFSAMETSAAEQLYEGRNEDFKELLVKSINFEDDTSIEEVLFKCFDYMCVVIKTINELKMGNTFYLKVLDEISEVLKNLKVIIKLQADFGLDTKFKYLLEFYDAEILGLLDEARSIANSFGANIDDNDK